MQQQTAKQRIEYLDGLRGVAILLVLGYHAFARWSDRLPYGGLYGDIWFFRHGSLGVQLFFLISGFVILMTLEKCQSMVDFVWRRWLRLFPAMLICSLLVFFSSPLFPERPAGEPTWLNLLPGLTFLPSNFWGAVLGQPVPPIEGAFWSLFVEFRFYVLAAIAYYWRGTVGLLILLLALFLFYASHVALTTFWPQSDYLHPLHPRWIQILAAEHMGWFCSGAMFYLFTQTRRKTWLAAAMVMAFLCALCLRPRDNSATCFSLAFSTLFALACFNKTTQNILSHPFLLLIGYISYPLYLMHENVMIASIIKLGQINFPLPAFLYPLIPIVGLVALSYVITKFCEPWLRKRLSVIPTLLRGLIKKT